MFELMTLGMNASAVPHDFHSRYVRACACVPVDSYAGECCKKKEKRGTLVISASEMGRADRQETGMLLTWPGELVVNTVRIP